MGGFHCIVKYWGLCDVTIERFSCCGKQTLWGLMCLSARCIPSITSFSENGDVFIPEPANTPPSSEEVVCPGAASSACSFGSIIYSWYFCTRQLVRLDVQLYFHVTKLSNNISRKCSCSWHPSLIFKFVRCPLDHVLRKHTAAKIRIYCISPSGIWAWICRSIWHFASCMMYPATSRKAAAIYYLNAGGFIILLYISSHLWLLFILVCR